jgi:carbamoyl-phosphate synthase large subunit
VHSGDSACSLPPYSLAPAVVQELRRQTMELARGLNVVGLMNVQFAIQKNIIYVLEVNPRASRTVPFVGKATGVPLAKIAARCMVGRSLAQQKVGPEVVPHYFSVKEAVFPFVKFPGVDTILGPEMKSTGEVMGVGASFGEAFVKSQLGASARLPEAGTAFISVRDSDKPAAVEVAKDLVKLGFGLLATRGTAGVLASHGVAVAVVNKVAEGRPHIVDMIKNGEISLIVNTVEERRSAISDSRSIRTSAVQQRVTYYTTVAGARAACEGMRHMKQSLAPHSLQELHATLR